MCVHVRGCVGACRRACVRVSVCFYIYMLYIEIYIYSINFQVIAALLTRVYALISFLFKNFFQKENQLSMIQMENPTPGIVQI